MTELSTRVATHMTLAGRRYVEMATASTLCAMLTLTLAIGSFAVPGMLVLPTRLLALIAAACAIRFSYAARRARRF